MHFSERLDEFVRGLPSDVAVVVACRTQEYEKLLAAHPTGLGLVQAVEMLLLTSQQLDSALAELARFDDDWETFLTQRHLTACQRARTLLSNPLFLNLAVAGHLNPRQLLECAEEQDPRELVLERYLDRVLVDQSDHEPASTRRHLTWVAWFLNGALRFHLSASGERTPPYSILLTSLRPSHRCGTGCYWRWPLGWWGCSWEGSSGCLTARG
jgi:hypothetical protein